ncbi:MAG: HAMP domain-containing sensor histidine kinase [Opitutaceae bacterium]|nr:HAMP domain-containing sensor histidine kinase [Opitutaceae bacterium]
MSERLRQSLALRLAIQYALVFALASGVLFTALYWVLADALEQRDSDAVGRRAEILAAAYDFRGLAGLQSQAAADRSPDQPAYFVRIVNADETINWVAVPRNWVETQVEEIPVGVFKLTRETRIARVPQNALRDYTIASRPLRDGRLLQVGRTTDSRAVLLAPLRRAFAVVGTGAAFLSVAVGTLLAWRATRPLRAVSATARRIIETGDFAARVPSPGGSGELAVLVRQLNTLLDKNAAHVRVLRETLDNLAHDLRTPLTRLRGTAELALQDAGDPAEARGALADCVNESDRLLHVLEALLDITAAEAGVLKLDRDQVDVRTLVERAVDLYREVAEEKRISVTLDHPEPVEASADSVRLGQAINNLLDNALKYTPEGGRVVLAARNEPGAAMITVSDNGPGVPASEREAIFRRLYRGDSSRSQRGLGLGLSLVKAIVESHRGSVSVENAPAGGARFTVRLPK